MNKDVYGNNITPPQIWKSYNEYFAISTCHSMVPRVSSKVDMMKKEEG